MSDTTSHDASRPRPVSPGDYVLASVHPDFDSRDPWRVGYVVRIVEWWRPRQDLPASIVKRYFIGEADGTWTDQCEYIFCRHITPEEGAAFLERYYDDLHPRK